ncbi:MAG: hypothetical protein GOVbin1096_21 [Prokaryotic dsDNA virus sp.]|jgi:hypothetical protein|nr:MAG: hypothetical protein GOVbin1096_21 [Prokaryotic dsDNA virus sp.]|tara:strand:- start:48741 stop:48968 length:228 start_codon:yes stop_codon:yes gene_type:complete
MLLNKGDAFVLTKDYLALDAGTVCLCEESEADTDAEFCIFAATPIGLLLVPCDSIRAYTVEDHIKFMEVYNESAQ